MNWVVDVSAFSPLPSRNPLPVSSPPQGPGEAVRPSNSKKGLCHPASLKEGGSRRKELRHHKGKTLLLQASSWRKAASQGGGDNRIGWHSSTTGT